MLLAREEVCWAVGCLDPGMGGQGMCLWRLEPGLRIAPVRGARWSLSSLVGFDLSATRQVCPVETVAFAQGQSRQGLRGVRVRWRHI